MCVCVCVCVCVCAFVCMGAIKKASTQKQTQTNPVGTLSRRVWRADDVDLSDEEKLKNQLVQGCPVPSVQIKVASPGIFFFLIFFFKIFFLIAILRNLRPKNTTKHRYKKTNKHKTDDLDIELPRDGKSMGELCIKGPTIATSYYKVDATDKFHKGWLLTGDIAVMTEKGEVILKDRSKDVIKSGGEWISSVDMENHIVAMDAVSMACVVAVPHPKVMQISFYFLFSHKFT